MSRVAVPPLSVKKKQDGTYDYRGDVSFRLVSRFVEQKVARKLMEHEMSELWDARRQLSALSGAAGYAGALFEAYAIKTICNGGDFTIFKNENHQQCVTLSTIKVPVLKGEPAILHPNKLDRSSLPFDKLLERTTDGTKFKPRLIWPETNNFPTFDSYYLHEDGEVYSFQMTVARDEHGFLKHDLNNGGAYQTMKYLDEFNTSEIYEKENKKVAVKRKYQAVFVVPAPCDRCNPKKQKFTGELKTSKKKTLSEEDAAKMMEEKFEQGIIYL